jgi:hypothetical protein
MSTYTPDRWLIVKINGNDPHYRVFGSWYGGYAGSDSWKLNSGITEVKEEGDWYLFSGTSGSVYRCHKKGYGTSGYGAGVLDHLIKTSDLGIEALPGDTDVMSLNYT